MANVTKSVAFGLCWYFLPSQFITDGFRLNLCVVVQCGRDALVPHQLLQRGRHYLGNPPGSKRPPQVDLPPVTVPVVKLLFAAPLGQPLHFVEA